MSRDRNGVVSIPGVLTGSSAPANRMNSGLAAYRLHERRHLLRLNPGWPLTWMLIGYPLWWLLGIAGFVPLISAAIMIGQLLHRADRVRVHRGFGLWLLFLVWVAVGVLLLQVSAPHAIADHSNGRYLTFAFRFAWYTAATVTLIYIYNLRDRLPTARIVRAFGWLFLTVVFGGILGTLTPTLDFPSALELFLPRGLMHVQYIHDLVHPVIAQVYSVDGVIQPRASAPFAYANDWGLNCATLLPFFVLGWLRGSTGWRRVFAIAMLVVSIYPLVKTENRGVWLALVIVALVIAIRSALFGRLRTIAWTAVIGVVVVAMLASTPIGGSITNRLENGYSNAGRAKLGALTVESVTAKSPVVGLGSTRNVEGSFYSIAGGDTSACSLCSPPALGTQGQFWLIIFSTGIGGLLFYLVFMALNLGRSIRRDTPLATVALAVLTMHLTTMFVYDVIGIELVTIFAAIGLLWRDLAGQATESPDGPSERTLVMYGSMVRRHRVLFASLTALGIAAGLAYDHVQPKPVTAQTSAFVPQNSIYPGQEQFAQSLDTIAGLLNSEPIRHKVASAIGETPEQVSQRLTVTAAPNTRVLYVRYSDASADKAARASLVAAKTLISVRSAGLRAVQQQVLSSLAEEHTGLATSIATLSRAHQSTDETVDELSAVEAQYQRVKDAATGGGKIVAQPRLLARSVNRAVDAVSGGAVGILIATIIAYVRQLTRARIGRRSPRSSVDGVWVLDTRSRLAGDELATASASRAFALRGTANALAAAGTTCVVGAHRNVSGLVSALQYELSDAPSARPPGHGVAIVASARQPRHSVATVRERLERCGLHVTSVVLADQRAEATYPIRHHKAAT